MSGSAPSPADHRLGELLEEEYYLLKVLECLLEDGLHECRRVCRAWNEACRKLAVKLTLKSGEHLASAKETFPNATSLSMRLAAFNWERGADLWKDVTPADDSLFQSLASIRRLRSLHLTNAVRGSLSEGMESALRSMDQLESLEICSSPEYAHHSGFLSYIRYLTNLTSLVLFGSDCRKEEDGFVHEHEPFTELTKIRDLDLSPPLLTSRDGQLMFPHLTGLTRLKCYINRSTAELLNGNVFKGLRAYASSLRCLGLGMYVYLRQGDLEFLKAFTRMESLEMHCLEDDRTDFYAVLKTMDSLTELKTDFVFSTGVVESLFSLSGLQSLSFHDPFEDRHGRLFEDPFPFSHLTQLTRLAIRVPELGVLLQSMINLVHLEVDCVARDAPDLIDSLSRMPHLETLDLFAENFEVPGIAISHLTKLKKLKIFTCGADETLLPVVASFPELTDLALRYSLEEGPSTSFLTDLKQISNLTSLKLDVPGFDEATSVLPSKLFEYLEEGSFPRLRHLYLSGEEQLEMKREAYRRFPDLRAFSSTFDDDYDLNWYRDRSLIKLSM